MVLTGAGGQRDPPGPVPATAERSTAGSCSSRGPGRRHPRRPVLVASASAHLAAGLEVLTGAGHLSTHRLGTFAARALRD